MTRNSDNGFSRRKFLIASGAAGPTGPVGYTKNNTDGDGSGGDPEGGSSSDDGSNKFSGIIDITGSSTAFPLATVMVERLQTEHSEVNINFQSTGSGDGFADYFRMGQTDLDNASRPIKGEEQDQCEGSDAAPVELKVTTDALMTIINNDNNFFGEGLTVKQLQTIFSAESMPTTWPDVSSEWPDKEIEICGPTNTSGTYNYFIKAVIREEGPGHRQDYSVTEQDRTIIQGVESSEYATGYPGFACHSENADAVQVVPIESNVGKFVEPPLNTTLSGKYNPLSRPLFTYPARESLAEEHVAGFARYWIENSTSHEIIADGVSYVLLDEDDQQRMLDTLNAAIEEAN